MMTYTLRHICTRVITVAIAMEVILLCLHFATFDESERRNPTRTVRNRPKHLKLLHQLAPPGQGANNSEKRSLWEGGLRDHDAPILVGSSNVVARTRPDSGPGIADGNHHHNSSDGNFSIEFDNSNVGDVRNWTCQDISKIELVDVLGRGTTKQAFLGRLNGSDVCVKMVTSSVTDIKACLRKQSFTEEQCFLLANYKLMKEIGLVLQLKHHSIIKMIGYCIRSEANTKNTEDHGVVMVTEVGVKVTPYRLQKMAWPQRLQAAVDLASLFHYMHTSPLGSLRMGDFKQSQFLLVNGRIKLSDLDDVTSEERKCTRDRDCRILAESANVPCQDGVCSGINSKANLLLGAVELLQPLLSGAPSSVRNMTEALLDDMNYKRISALQMKQRLRRVVDEWRGGVTTRLGRER